MNIRFEQLLQDLRFGCRILTKSPAISATAVALIALVIGGNTTVFTIAHSVLSKPAPGVHAGRLATVSWLAENGDIETHASYAVYEQFLEHGTAFRPVAAFDFARVTMSQEDGAFAMRAALVSPNYFDTLGVRLVKGRTFTADEARGSSGLPVVVAHHVWQNSFRGANFAEFAELWVPINDGTRSRLQPNRSSTDVAMIGQRSDGASLTEALT